MSSGSKLSDLVREKKSVKEELKKCTQEAEDLGKQLSALHGYKELLEGRKRDIEMLSSQIHTLVSIWQSVSQ